MPHAGVLSLGASLRDASCLLGAVARTDASGRCRRGQVQSHQSAQAGNLIGQPAGTNEANSGA
jgi:hypothetical protein